MKLLYNFKNSRISSVVIINGLNLLSSFQQGIFPELVRPKGNCKDISLSILFYSSVAKSDTRIRWSIYQMILAWIVIQLLNPFPFHYNTCYNSHQRAFSKENYNTVCIMTYIYVLCIIPIINISIYMYYWLYQYKLWREVRRCRISWPLMAMAGGQLELPRRDKAVVTATQQVPLQKAAETSSVWNCPGRFFKLVSNFPFFCLLTYFDSALQSMRRLMWYTSCS